MAVPARMSKYSIILLFITLLASVLFFLKIQKENELLKKEMLPQKLSFVKRDPSHMWGEPAKLMFPDITNPKYVNAKDAKKFLNENDDVYFFKTGDTFYIYPASILGFHHIINDTINNKPVTATLCLLSDSALLYSRIVDGKTLSMGVLGPLYYGNLVMYDKETDSYWFQLTGYSFKGKLTGKRLNFITVLQKTTWMSFTENDKVKVLSPIKDISFYRNFYNKYNSSTIGINSLKGKRNLDTRLPALKKGLGINVDNYSRFYPLELIKEKQLINDTVGSYNLLILFDKRYNSYKIYRSFLNNKILTFENKGDYFIDKQTQSVWNFDSFSIDGKLKGKKLDSLIYTQVYWFSWSAFYPQTQIAN